MTYISGRMYENNYHPIISGVILTACSGVELETVTNSAAAMTGEGVLI